MLLCEDLEWIKNGKPIKIAIKTPFPSSLGRKRSAVDRFLNEALLWVELGKHPNIVQALYVKKIKGMPYIFMEYVQAPPAYGPDLESWIVSGTMTLERVLDFSIQFCNGMIYANQCFAEKGLRFVHRDIKPGNTMINHRLEVKISDFGIAKLAAEAFRKRQAVSTKEKLFKNLNITQAGAILGTPNFMSPEQCQGVSDLGIPSDIYSFGCMLFMMITRDMPFQSSSCERLLNKHIHEPPPEPSSIVPGIPPSIEQIILKCLNKKPQDRYADFLELLKALEQTSPNLADRKAESGQSRVKNEPNMDFGQKLNKSLSLYALGRKKEGVRLFVEAIEKKRHSGSSPSSKTGAVQDDVKRRLVRGGIAPKPTKSPRLTSDGKKEGAFSLRGPKDSDTPMPPDGPPASAKKKTTRKKNVLKKRLVHQAATKKKRPTRQNRGPTD